MITQLAIRKDSKGQRMDSSALQIGITTEETMVTVSLQSEQALSVKSVHDVFLEGSLLYFPSVPFSSAGGWCRGHGCVVKQGQGHCCKAGADAALAEAPAGEDSRDSDPCSTFEHHHFNLVETSQWAQKL